MAAIWVEKVINGKVVKRVLMEQEAAQRIVTTNADWRVADNQGIDLEVVEVKKNVSPAAKSEVVEIKPEPKEDTKSDLAGPLVENGLKQEEQPKEEAKATEEETQPEPKPKKKTTKRKYNKKK